MLPILRHVVETTKMAEIGQWCINWINHYHHSSKEKTKQLQHIQSSWTRREWSRRKARLGSYSWVGDVVKNLLHNSQILKFLFINITEGGDFHFLVCFYLLWLFHTHRKCNCFTGLWNQIFEPISEFYLIVRLKITGKFQTHTVEKGNFFLMLAILRRFKLLSHQNSNINMETIPWLPAFCTFSINMIACHWFKCISALCAVNS